MNETFDIETGRVAARAAAAEAFKAFFDRSPHNVDWDWHHDGAGDVLIEAVFNLDDLLEEVLQAALAMQGAGWQPIDTAPRDGNWLLLTGGVVREECHLEHEFGRRPVVGRSCSNDWECWFICDISDGLGGGLFYDQPTHWMPLPVEPEGSGRAA